MASEADPFSSGAALAGPAKPTAAAAAKPLVAAPIAIRRMVELLSLRERNGAPPFRMGRLTRSDVDAGTNLWPRLFPVRETRRTRLVRISRGASIHVGDGQYLACARRGTSTK